MFNFNWNSKKASLRECVGFPSAGHLREGDRAQLFWLFCILHVKLIVVWIICHLFITQAISLPLFAFQQDPGHVWILNTDWPQHVSAEKKKGSQTLFSAANGKTATD